MPNRSLIAGLTAALIAFGACGSSNGENSSEAKEANPMVLISTSLGDVKVELYADKAPISTKNFLDYAKAGYYDGTIFHRVIPGFMIQGGGMTPEMREKTPQRPAIKNEGGNGLKNETGTLAMARTSAPDSATSQFFINVKDNAFLDRANSRDGVGYAVFGRVVDGMDVVRKIEKVHTTSKGMHENVPVEAVTIVSMKVLE
jgi:cyclophilin family peptidyl-prolyl cis-trans isomerase